MSREDLLLTNIISLLDWQGSSNLEVLQIQHHELGPLCVGRQNFLKLQYLRFLALKNVELHGDFTDLFPKLRFLIWRISCGKSIPTNLCLKNLVALILSVEKFMDRREVVSLFEVSKYNFYRSITFISHQLMVFKNYCNYFLLFRQ